MAPGRRALDDPPAALRPAGAAPVAARNRRTALGLLAWIAVLVLASVAVAWLRN